MAIKKKFANRGNEMGGDKRQVILELVRANNTRSMRGSGMDKMALRSHEIPNHSKRRTGGQVDLSQ